MSPFTRLGAPYRAIVARETPALPYIMVLACTMGLTLLGLFMVLSSSSIQAVLKNGSPFGVFGKQLLVAAIALPLMWGASLLPVRVWQRVGWALLGVAALLQVLVIATPLGYGTKGNKNWLRVGGFQVQPSEGLKLALVVLCAAILTKQAEHLTRWQTLLFPLITVVAGSMGLVLAGKDMGTGLVMVLLVAGAVFTSGVPLRFLAIPGLVVAVCCAVFVWVGPSRRERFAQFLNGSCDPLGDSVTYIERCFQPVHGQWALASGGIFGLGPGASREKWSNLPEAHNDYIFAIVAEELGMTGTFAVLAMFTLLAWAMTRIIVSSDSRFVQIATAATMTWVVGQAFMNMAVVLNLAPVIGVPLPFVSSGGSALLSTLAAMGMVLAFARQLPGAKEDLAHRWQMVRAGVSRRPLPRER